MCALPAAIPVGYSRIAARNRSARTPMPHRCIERIAHRRSPSTVWQANPRTTDIFLHQFSVRPLAAMLSFMCNTPARRQTRRFPINRDQWFQQQSVLSTNFSAAMANVSYTSRRLPPLILPAMSAHCAIQNALTAQQAIRRQSLSVIRPANPRTAAAFPYQFNARHDLFNL